MVDYQSLKNTDYRISKKFSQLLSYDGITRKFFQIITLSGTAVTWWILLVIAYIFDPQFRVEAYSMIMITNIMTLAVFIIKISVKRKRPDFKDDRYFAVSFDIFSFPSGHATRAAYVAILMPLYVPNLTVFWILWSFTMILSRLFLGVHYISDIIAGLLFGSISILLLFAFGVLPTFPFSDIVIDVFS